DARAAGACPQRERRPRPAQFPRRSVDERGPGTEAPALAQERLPGEAPARSRRGGAGHAGACHRDPRTHPRGGARVRAVKPALGRSFASLSVPNYRRYFFGQIVSLSSTWMQTVGELWLVLTLTGSAVAVGVTTALQFTPILLFGAWAGVLADRMDKRKLLLFTQTAMPI